MPTAMLLGDYNIDSSFGIGCSIFPLEIPVVAATADNGRWRY
jgi:hypothetical protein